MIIDPDYGPQFDPTDGTIGQTQLVRRWVIKRGPGLFDFFAPYRQGRYTYATKEECEAHAQLFIDNPTNRRELVEGLFAEEWWCYPGHFDPAHPVNEYPDPELPDPEPPADVAAAERKAFTDYLKKLGF